MRGLALMLAALLLAACASPYSQALNSAQPPRPEPPVTPADQRALAPYDTPLFD